MSSPSIQFDPQPPPPAPPLPPQASGYYSQKAATAIARIAQPFFSGQRISSWPNSKTAAGLSGNHDAAASFSSSVARGEAVHKTGLQISAVDISPYRTHAILAGRDILKTVRVNDSTCVEDVNLRSRITAYASAHDRNRDAVTAQHRDQLVAVDVKWSHGNYDSTIATAAANGRIVIYDLNRPSVEIARLHEHTRQVHRIAFNPHQGAFLLSASQDGTTRLWDLRALHGSVRTCISRMRFSANTQGVRDVQWSPEDGYAFAIGTENGVIQKWTLSKESSPLLRLHGHDHSCSSIAWHPEGRFLASASAENLVKVWDFGTEDRRMKPISIIRTPQAVANVKWRPASVEDGGNFGSTATQLSTSYDAKDPRIHVWDLKRPSVPILEVDKYDTPATGMVWYSRDLLWTVGNTGTFTQNDLTTAIEPPNRHGSALAIDPTGRMAFFSTKKSKHNFLSEFMRHQIGESQIERVHSIKNISPENQSNDSLISRRRRRTEDLAIGDSFGSAFSLEEDRPKKLDELKAFLSPSFSSPQLASVISLQSVSNAMEFIWLAEHYRLPSRMLLVGRDPVPDKTIEKAFEENATLAELVGDTRLAQTWRIVGFAVRIELRRRLASVQKNGHQPAKVPTPKVSQEKMPNGSKEAPVPTKAVNTAARLPLSTLSTPLARPRQDLSMPQISLGDGLSTSSPTGIVTKSQSSISRAVDNLINTAVFSESADWQASDNQSASDVSLDMARHALRQRGSAGLSPQFTGFEAEMEERRNALGDYRARPRTVLNLDASYQAARESSPMTSLDRYDSNESFQMFSASADSDRQSFPMDDSPDDQKIRYQDAGSLIKKSRLPDYKKWKANQVEDSGQVTPQIIEPRQSVDKPPLYRTEQQRVTKTDDTSSTPLLQRPTDSRGPKIHMTDFRGPELTEADASTVLPSNIFSHSKGEDPVPWDIYSLLKPLLEFHIDELGDCQLPTMLALWLWQYFPTEFERPQITALALFYQRRLHDLELFEPLAQLRKIYNLLFPEVLEQTTGSQAVPLFCRSCNKTYEPDESSTCPRCKKEIANCSICEAPIPPPSLSTDSTPPDTNLWSWCQGCGHGGHASCLSTWFSAAKVAQGTCPVPGCAHDCVAGERRELVVAEIEAQRRRSRKAVIKDEWAVPESRAVEKARDIVGVDNRLGARRGIKAETTSTSGVSSIKGDIPGPNTSTGRETPTGSRRVRLKIGGESTTQLQSGKR